MIDMFRIIDNELNERNKRKNKIVILNLTESKYDEKNNINKLFDYLQVNRPIFFKRLNSNSNAYPRPIECTLSDAYNVKLVLNVSNNLKKSKHYEKVYINRHLTNLQREIKRIERLEKKTEQTKR